MKDFLKDLRFGLRTMGRTPGFTAVAILVLALGIGGTAAMFTLINGLVWRPIVAKNPEQLVRVYSKENKPEGGYRSFSYFNFAEIRQQNAAFTDLAAFQLAMVGVKEGDLTRRTFAAVVSTNYFTTFGVRLQSGRAFSAEEEKPGSAVPVVVVSDSYWRKTGSSPDIIGKRVRINTRTLTVIGIAPANFTGTSALFAPEFWLPLGMYEAVANDFSNVDKKSLADPRHHILMLLGRLKTGETIPQAQAALRPLAASLADAYPDVNKDQIFELGKLSRLSISPNPHAESIEVSSLLLLGMSAAVLLIACFNLGNMLLARSAARRKEIAIRLALGASRSRLICQLLTEGLLLSIIGAAVGLLLAIWADQILVQSMAPKIPFINVVFETRPDWRVLTATFGACLLSVLVFGLAPAWKLTRIKVTTYIKEQVGEEMHSRTGSGLFPLRSLLVVGQLALSVALLTGAGLFAHTAINAIKANPGFSFDHLLLVETDAGLARYDDLRGKQLYLQLLDRLRALPGVESATLSYIVPFGLFSDGCRVERIGGAPVAQPGSSSMPTDKPLDVGFNIVGTDYFKTVGLRLLRGREFDSIEVSANSSARVAVIDEPLAQKLWPGEDPIGRNINLPDKSGAVQIVGLVPGIRNDLSDKSPQPHVYVPFGQDYRSGVNLHLKLKPMSPDGEAAVIRGLRDTVHSVDANLPVISIRMMRQFHEEGLMVWFVKAGARMFGMFGALALILAVAGVYGVNAYVVTRRTREIGIRVALGASTRSVLWIVLRQALILATIGVAIGLLLALALGFALRSAVFGSKAIEPLAFIAGPLCLVAASLIACYLPARRASSIEPVTALRYE